MNENAYVLPLSNKIINNNNLKKPCIKPSKLRSLNKISV